MKKPTNFNQHLFYMTNRILSFLALCVVYNIFSAWSKKEHMMLSLDGMQYFAMEVFMYVSLGFLLGWFLCDNISVTANKARNIVMIIILIVLSTYKITYFTMGSMGMMSGQLDLSMTVFYLAKYSQIALGIFVFFIIYGEIKAKFSKQEVTAHDKKGEDGEK